MHPGYGKGAVNWISAVDLLIFFDTKISVPSDSVLDGGEFLGVRILLVIVFGIGGRWSWFMVKEYLDRRSLEGGLIRLGSSMSWWMDRHPPPSSPPSYHL